MGMGYGGMLVWVIGKGKEGKLVGVGVWGEGKKYFGERMSPAISVIGEDTSRKSLYEVER